MPSLGALGEASFASYARVVGEGKVQRAMLNTLIMVLASGTIVMALSSLIAWFSVRGRTALARYVDVLSFAPTAVPPIVMVMAVLLLYLQSPLYGTLWILILGHVTIYIAFGTRSMGAALLQIHKELADAASISGAGWFTGNPTDIIALAGTYGDKRIMLGRFSVETTNMLTTDVLTLQFRGNITMKVNGATAGSGTTTQPFFDETFTYGFVPAPGAFTLLGLAGLMVRRRR